MRVFGSLQNRIAEDVKPPVPTVGMGGTILMFTDREAVTVIELKGDKRIVVQADTAKRTDKNGMSESQEYAYTADPKGATYEFSLRKDGRWKQSGSRIESGTVLMLGERDAYHDYSF